MSINKSFADNDPYILNTQLLTAQNNPSAFNASLIDNGQVRSKSAVFNAQAVTRVQATPLPDVTSAGQGTVGAALAGVGQQGAPISSGGGSGGGGGGGCFVASTPILMADGTLKSIQSIVVGEDRVKAFDENGDIYPARVIGKWEHVVPEYLKIEFETGRVTRTTSIHRYWTGTEFKHIIELDEVLLWDGTRVKITEKEVIKDEKYVYNLTVEKYHTYIANGHMVSNLKPAPGDQGLNESFKQNVD